MKKIFKTRVLFLLLGLFLISLNLVGFLIPLRNVDIYNEEKNYFKDDIVFTEEKLLKELKSNNESDKDFIVKANNAVFNGIAHYWKNEGINKYNLRIPIYENYILYIASYLYPAKFQKYEFSNVDRAIERGIGLCSQHAIVLSKVLEDNGIDSKIITLPRHVVVTAQVDKNDEWWVVDPDFGVIIKNNINEIEESPSLVSSVYSKKGYNTSIVNDLTETYGNVLSIHDSAKEYSGVKRYYFEELSYIAIWVIPLLMIAFSIYLSKKNISKNNF